MMDIFKMSATEIAKSVRSKKLSATEVTRAHLERIQSINASINAVVQKFPDEALASAVSVDELISQGKDPGVLCGVPITIKVNGDQIGQATTNGLNCPDFTGDPEVRILGYVKEQMWKQIFT